MVDDGRYGVESTNHETAASSCIFFKGGNLKGMNHQSRRNFG